MIELTRLNGNRMAVNNELIQFADAAPDTVLTMVTGEKLIVAESLAEIAEKVMRYRAHTMAETSRLFPGGAGFMSGAGSASSKALDAVDRDELDKQC